MGSETDHLYKNKDFDLSIDEFSKGSSKLLDDDGRPKRTGNVTEKIKFYEKDCRLCF